MCSAQVQPISLHLVARPSFRTPAGHIRGAGELHEGWYPLQRPSADEKHLTQEAASCVNGWRTGESGLTDFSRPLSPWVHAAQVLRSQVFCKKAKLKFSSPGGTAQRPFQGRWPVLLDPNWFHQDHQAAIHRRRTAASGTTEFQIRPNSQLQRKYAPPELIGHRKRPLRGAPTDLQVDA